MTLILPESINVDGLTSGDSEIEFTLQAKRQEDLGWSTAREHFGPHFVSLVY